MLITESTAVRLRDGAEFPASHVIDGAGRGHMLVNGRKLGNYQFSKFYKWKDTKNG